MYASISLLVAFFVVTRRAIADPVPSTHCFIKSNNVTEENKRSPCGIVNTLGYLSCCGVGDKCLQNGLCSTIEKPGSLTAGFYVGGCTDPNLSDSTCNPACSDLERNSIVYNATSSKWQCCGQTNGQVNCSDPTDESFSAPAPSALSATYTIGATSTPSSSAIIGPSSSGGLSGGAKAGVAVGCIVGAFLIFGIFAFLYARRRRHHRQAQLEANRARKEQELQQMNDPPPPQNGHFPSVSAASASYTLPSFVSRISRPGGGPAMQGLLSRSPDVAEAKPVMPAKPVEKYSELEGGHGGLSELPGSQAAQAELPQWTTHHEMS